MEAPTNSTVPLQIGCGYCRNEKFCELHKIWWQNKLLFKSFGITTRTIATACNSFQNINIKK